MDIYRTPSASFDLHETHSGRWTVIRMPDFSRDIIGTGQYMATFTSRDEAQQFCDTLHAQQAEDGTLEG